MAEFGDEISTDEFPRKSSSILRGSDVAGKVIRATIMKTGSTTFSDGRRVRTLYVTVAGEKEEKSFALNRGNTQTLAQAYGSKTAAWVGKTVQLTTTKANNPQTKTQVDSILVIAS